MDYRKAYLDVYDPIIKQQEKKVIQYLHELKNQKRKWQSANSKVASILFQDLKDFQERAPFHIHYQIPDYINNRNDYYNEEESLNLILQNEVQDLFDDGTDLNLNTYEEFIKVLATYQGLENARRNYASLRWLVELYYENNEIEKIKLAAFQRNIKEHEDYIRLIGKGLITKKEINTSKKSSQKSKKVESQSIIPDLENDEKLLLIHYLVYSGSLEKIEKIKILALLGTTPIEISIFQQESRVNQQYNKVTKGYEYFGKKYAKDILSSLYEQVESFQISGLNRAIKMDLNKIKKKEVQKVLKKN